MDELPNTAVDHILVLIEKIKESLDDIATKARELENFEDDRTKGLKETP